MTAAASTTHSGNVGVKEDNGQHRDGAQAPDVGTESRLRGPLICTCL